MASVSTSALPAGSSPSPPTTSATAIFLPSSGSVIHTVSKAATTTAVVSSLNPSIFSQLVTFTATVSPSTATGSVDFSIDGVVSNVALVAGSATLSTLTSRSAAPR